VAARAATLVRPSAGLDLALARDVGEHGHELLAMRHGLALLVLRADAAERALEARLVTGFSR